MVNRVLNIVPVLIKLLKTKWRRLVILHDYLLLLCKTITKTMNFRIKLLMLFFPVVLFSANLYGQATPDDVKWINGKKHTPHKILPKDLLQS